MSHYADLSQLGFLPLQAFPYDFAKESDREKVRCGRIVEHDNLQSVLKFGGQSVNPDGTLVADPEYTLGDLIGSLMLTPYKAMRCEPAWVFGIPATYYRSEGRETTPGAENCVPIKNRLWLPDRRLQDPGVEFPIWVAKVPGKWIGILCAGTETRSQEPVYVPGFIGLVASWRGEPDYSTHVFDVDSDGNLDLSRYADLHRFLRVIKSAELAEPVATSGSRTVPRSASKTKARKKEENDASKNCDLAWQIGAPSYGFCAGQKIGTHAQVIGVASWLKGGPLYPGTPSDRHHLGSSADGDSIKSLHITTTALFKKINDDVRDGPIDFEDTFYQDVSEGSELMPCHLRYDAEQQKWRIQSESVIGERDPVTPSPNPRTPRTVPRDPTGTVPRDPTGTVPRTPTGSTPTDGYVPYPEDEEGFSPWHPGGMPSRPYWSAGTHRNLALPCIEFVPVSRKHTRDRALPHTRKPSARQLAQYRKNPRSLKIDAYGPEQDTNRYDTVDEDNPVYGHGGVADGGGIFLRPPYDTWADDVANPSSSNIYEVTLHDKVALSVGGTPDASAASTSDYHVRIENDLGITVEEQSAPATPDSGYGRVYMGTDGHLHQIDDTGTDYDLTEDSTGTNQITGYHVMRWSGDGTGDIYYPHDGKNGPGSNENLNVPVQEGYAVALAWSRAEPDAGQDYYALLTSGQSGRRHDAVDVDADQVGVDTNLMVPVEGDEDWYLRILDAVDAVGGVWVLLVEGRLINQHTYSFGADVGASRPYLQPNGGYTSGDYAASAEGYTRHYIVKNGYIRTIAWNSEGAANASIRVYHNGSAVLQQMDTSARGNRGIYRDIDGYEVSAGDYIEVQVGSNAVGEIIVDIGVEPLSDQGYCLTFGALAEDGADEYLQALGSPNGTQFASSQWYTKHPIPKNGTLTSIAWSSQSSDNTTVLEVKVNGTTQQSVTLTGSSGQLALSDLSVSAGDYVEVMHDSGTTPDEIVLSIYCKTS